ncbi:MAG: hypothetical protein WC247_07735 [Porticoccaceae bacterium]
MRALAEFIMRGRWQASVVALLGNLLPLVSPATVGLVTLRHSLQEGLLVALWAALPLVVMLYLSDVNPLLAVTSLIGLVAVIPASETLRRAMSWPLALMVSLAVSAGGCVLAGLLAGPQLELLLTDLQQVLVALKSGDSDGPQSVFYLLMAATAVGLGLEQVSAAFVLGFLSWLVAMQAVATLLLARWWQALLYNPGGFRAEFHGLRFDRALATGLVVGIMACNLGSSDYSTWVSLLGVPLLLAGLGLVHHVVQFWHLGVQWLVLLYIGLLVFGPLSMVLIGIGFLDSFFDFRARIPARKGK